MALIKCPECGKEISDRAEKCPNCGLPIYEIKKDNNTVNKGTENIVIDSEVSKQEELVSVEKNKDNNEKDKPKKKKKGLIILVIGAVLMFILIGCMSLSTTDTTSTTDDSNDVVTTEPVDEKVIKQGKEDLSTYFNENYDDVEEITWFRNANEPQYIDIRSYVLPYIGRWGTSGNPWVVIRWNYTGNDWIFYNKIIVKTDNHTYNITPNYSDINRDNDTEVWETYDQVKVEEKDLAMLLDMGTSQKCTVRFKGDNNSYDLDVSDSDKATFVGAYNAYYYLQDVYNNKDK